MADETITIFTPVQLVVPESKALEPDTVLALQTKFNPLFLEAVDIFRRAEAMGPVTDITQKGRMQEAKKLRGEFVKLRGKVAGAHKEAKEDSLKKGKSIDNIKNLFFNRVGQVEDWLLKQETFEATKIAEEKETLRRHRAEAFAIYADRIAPPTLDLTALSESDFTSMLAGYEQRYTAAKVAEEEAEKNRTANEKHDREEREKLAKENAALQEQQRVRSVRTQQLTNIGGMALANGLDLGTCTQEQFQRISAEAVSDKKKRDETAEADRKKRESENTEIERQRKEIEGQQAKLREEEMQRQMDERQAQEEAAAAAVAPDAEKLETIAMAVETFRDALPAVSSIGAAAILEKFVGHLTQSAAWLRKQKATLK